MDEKSLNIELEKCFKNFDASIGDIQKVYRKIWHQIDTYQDKESIPRNFLAEMAGNLAHEIRNPLGGIANFVALLSDGQDSKKSKSVEGILQGIERIDKIVENLIVFSRPMVTHVINCNLSDIIQSAVNTVKGELIAGGTDYSFILSLPEDEVFARVDPGLLRQALQNILQNSIENMPDGGKITISLLVNKKRNVLRLTIRDQGHGLIDGDEEKPFYPFYTTKTYGMGLGLSTTRLILEKHNGQIKLMNKHRKGVE
ncbi:MAG: PAS domain-containing sensor histidine kinase, partial [bacterium]